MEPWLVVLILVGAAVFLVLLFHSYLINRDFAAELARRPARQYTVAGLDKDRVVGRHAAFASGPLRRRHLRRVLDAAQVKIERFEAEERDRRGR